LGPEHFVLVLTTFPADRDADHFARTLVEERLAACVNVLPAMRSIYSWKGEIENSEERQLIIKTSKTQVASLQARFHDLHPYDVPEFLVIPIDEGSPAYLAWLSENTSK
jgi:periplasmic divalent cation tolerance protein